MASCVKRNEVQHMKRQWNGFAVKIVYAVTITSLILAIMLISFGIPHRREVLKAARAATVTLAAAQTEDTP